MKQSFEDFTPKRISYILVTKDRAKFLEKALFGVKKLKKKNDELIIVDGNSKDGTKKVIKKYAGIIDKFISEKDISEGHAYNKGILISCGRYIKIITDDDIFYSEGIEKAIEILEKNKEVEVLLCGGTRVVDGKKQIICLQKGVNYGKNVSDVFRYGCCGIGLIFRKKILAKVGLYNAHAMALDLDFVTQCIDRGAVVKFARINLFTHPVESHSGTINRKNEWFSDRKKIIKRYGIKERNFRKNTEILLDRYFSNRITGLLKKMKIKIIPKKNKEKTEIVWDGEFS